MRASQQASELDVGNDAYEKIFQRPVIVRQPLLCNIPLNKLHPFYTADIGFRPYPPAKLQALADHMDDNGQLERIIVRSIRHSDEYEILAGHNRTNAAKLNGWEKIEAEVVEANDERATTIAVATNLLRRQDLTIIERGLAYKALLEAHNRQGMRSDILTFGELRQKLGSVEERGTFGEVRQKLETIQDDATSGEVRQKLDARYMDFPLEKFSPSLAAGTTGEIVGMAPKHNARKIVAEFFGVTEYEIRKAVKMTQLIPGLREIIEARPNQLPLACAEKIADYNAVSQRAFFEMCSIEGYSISRAVVNYIVQKCPPPRADKQALYEAWREARAAEEQKRTAPPKEIRFSRKRFAPYLEILESDAELESLFLEFLRSRYG